MTMNDVFLVIIGAWAIFNVFYTIGSWFRKPAPVPPEFWARMRKELGDEVLDLYIKLQEAQTYEGPEVPKPPTPPASNNGHEENDAEELMAASYRARGQEASGVERTAVMLAQGDELRTIAATAARDAGMTVAKPDSGKAKAKGRPRKRK